MKRRDGLEGRSFAACTASHGANSKGRRARNRWRVFGIVALAAVAASVAASIFSVSASPAADRTTVRIAFYGLQKNAMDYVVKNFNRANPNINAKPVYYTSSQELFAAYPAQIAAGNAPDILMTIVGNGTPLSVVPLVKAKKLAPITGSWNNNKLSIPSVRKLNTIGGKVYAYTPGVSTAAWAANTGLLSKLGVKVPSTFADVLNVCRKAKAAGRAGLLAPGADQQSMWILASGAAPGVFAKHPNWLADRKKNKTTFASTPEWRVGFQRIADMNRAGCFQAGAAGTSFTNMLAMFANGQGAFAAGQDGQLAGISTLNPKLQWKLFPPPQAKASDPSVSLTPTFSLSVNAKSKVKKQALTFIDFFSQPKQSAPFNKLAVNISATDFNKGTIPPLWSRFRSQIKQGKTIINPVLSWWNPLVLQVASANASGLLTGQKTPDDILKAMDVAWNKGPNAS